MSRYVPSGAGTARVVLARTSLPPCFSVIAMPAINPGLSDGTPQRGLVHVRSQAGHPLGREVFVPTQRGHRGVRHRDRAQVAALDLRPNQEAGGAGHVRAALVERPRGGMQARHDRRLHQPVVRRVVAHLVAAVAVPVVGVQHRLVPVCLPAPGERLRAACPLAEGAELLGRPAGAEPLHRLGQRGVRTEDVVALERGDLVEDLVGAGHALIVTSRGTRWRADHRPAIG